MIRVTRSAVIDAPIERVGAVYPLPEAAEAHRALEGRRTVGPVVLLP